MISVGEAFQIEGAEHTNWDIFHFQIHEKNCSTVEHVIRFTYDLSLAYQTKCIEHRN